MGHKYIKKVVTICSITLLIVLTFGYKPTIVYGEWNNNAIDFINTYGEKNALYKDGGFWFGSWATSNGTIKYRTIGWQISIIVQGHKYTVNSRVGGSTTVVDKRMRSGTSNEYSLWKIDYNTITKKLKDKYPNIDFSELADKTVTSKYKFDAIMTTGIVSNGVVNVQGDIYDNGDRAWGSVYYNVQQILGAAAWTGSAPEDIVKLFNKTSIVNGNEKPETNDEYAPINNKLVVEKYDYKESDTVYWVKPNREAQIFVEGYTPTSSQIYPDYNILNLFLNGSNYNLKGYATPNQNAYGTEDFNNEFNLNGSKSQAWTNCYAPRNYLHSNFFLSSKYDNRDYLLNYTSQWKNMNRPYTNSGIWLKTDGTAPWVTIEPDGKSWGKENLNVKIKSGDDRSGLAYTKVWTRKNEGSWDDLGENVSTVKFNGSGIYDVCVEAVDKVGNVTPNYIERRFYIDQEPPIIEGKITYDLTSENAIIEQSAYDSWGSGMNRIELYDNSNTKIASGTDKLNYTVTKEGITNYTVKAFDNVGNIATKKVEVKVDKFKITATIERVLDPHEPIFRGGEKGLLKVKMNGGVEKLKITFPTELTDEDNTLNTEFIITPEPYAEKEYEFFVPTYAKSKDYKVQVIGYKNGKEKEVYPSFTVRGSILNQLRTRIRIR